MTERFWEGDEPLKGISAGSLARYLLVFTPIWTLAFVTLTSFRFYEVPSSSVMTAVGVFFLAGGCQGIGLFFVQRIMKKELALGYTTTRAHPEVPRIDPETRLIIRDVGEPEPDAEQFRQIEKRIRQLKAEQRAAQN